MNHTQIYIVALLMISVVAAVLMILGWLEKSSPMGKSYSGLMLVITLWIILFATVLLVPANLTRFFSILEYFTILALPVVWLIFAYKFAGIKGWATPGGITLILILPVFLFIVAAVDKNCGLLYNHSKFFDNIPSFETPLGTKLWMIMHISIALIYFILGTYMVLKKISRSPQVQSNQAFVLTVGVLIPWIGNITFIFRVSTFFPNLDIAPFVFVLAGSLLAWGLFYNRFVNLINMAHDILIERMTDGVVILDSQNWVMDVNIAAQNIFRVNKSAMIGQPVQYLFKVLPELKNMVRSVSVKNHEVTIPQGNKKRYFNLNINPIYTSKGILTGRIFAFRETTELKETVQRWEDAKTIAANAETLKTAFLANMSHEIKTPMNAIMGFSNLLNDKSISEEEREEFVSHIRNSGSSLLHLIDDIIDISKLDAGQIVLKNSAFQLRRLLSELYAQYSDVLLEKGKDTVELVLNNENTASDLAIIGDKERIRQVLSNLIDNAIKFTLAGRVEFGYTINNNKTLEFYVADTGIGIPFEKQTVIFERFGRVATSTRQEFGGTGLGLSLSKGLVRLFNGKIWVESVLGKGSTFYFTHDLIIADDFIPDARPFAGYEAKPPGEEKETIAASAPEAAPEVTPEPEPIPEPVPETAPEPVPETAPEPVPEPVPETAPIPEPAPAPEPAPQAVPEPVANVAAKADTEASPEAARGPAPESGAASPTGSDLIFEAKDAPTTSLEEETKEIDASILVIEYDDMTYLFLEMVLRTTKINVIRAKSLRQGMNLLRSGAHIDGVMISSEVPDARLAEACRAVRQKFPRMLVIALTPFASKIKRQECINAGCSFVVAKPIKQKDLLAAVQNIVTLR